MKVTLLTCTPDADKVCAAAARSCYSSKGATELKESINPAKALPKVIAMGHHSVLEHAVFTFSVEGVSRSLTHQLVRHRIASYSQQSQRYVSMDGAGYVTPETVEEMGGDAAEVYHDAMEAAWESYSKLVELGIPKEDARFVLPNGCTTNITVTMNARELHHFFSLRCCNRAQWEIREMACRMLEICREESPVIFSSAGPECVRRACPEGAKSCGHPWKRV